MQLPAMCWRVRVIGVRRRVYKGRPGGLRGAKRTADASYAAAAAIQDVPVPRSISGAIVTRRSRLRASAHR